MEDVNEEEDPLDDAFNKCVLNHDQNIYFAFATLMDNAPNSPHTWYFLFRIFEYREIKLKEILKYALIQRKMYK